jgi:hypothetical protein
VSPLQPSLLLADKAKRLPYRETSKTLLRIGIVWPYTQTLNFALIFATEKPLAYFVSTSPMKKKESFITLTH